jgi:transposase InsO family protein
LKAFPVSGRSSRNGKIERWHKSLKRECIRPLTPLTLEDARRLVEGYVEHYNKRPPEQCHRLHHAEGRASRVRREVPAAATFLASIR